MLEVKLLEVRDIGTEAQRGATVTTWQPISTAPNETELLVGKWVNDEWRICQSSRHYDEGSYMDNEPAYWYWASDWDNGGVTDDEGPSHWQPLPPPPSTEMQR